MSWGYWCFLRNYVFKLQITHRLECSYEYTIKTKAKVCKCQSKAVLNYLKYFFLENDCKTKSWCIPFTKPRLCLPVCLTSTNNLRWYWKKKSQQNSRSDLIEIRSQFSNFYVLQPLWLNFYVTFVITNMRNRLNWSICG